MKKYSVYLLTICVIALFGCSKSSGGGTPTPTPTPTPQEQAIAFTIDAINNSVSTSSNFGVNLTLTSTMPSSGIKIDITTTDQITSAVVQNQSFTSSLAKNTLTVATLIQQHWNNVTIKVSSVANSSNSSSQSFTVVYK
ncbi:MAG: hypothetical protein WCL56_11710 [Sediminibacterium sp.]|jgi:hypothetical protein